MTNFRSLQNPCFQEPNIDSSLIIDDARQEEQRLAGNLDSKEFQSN